MKDLLSGLKEEANGLKDPWRATSKSEIATSSAESMQALERALERFRATALRAAHVDDDLVSLKALCRLASDDLVSVVQTIQVFRKDMKRAHRL